MLSSVLIENKGVKHLKLPNMVNKLDKCQLDINDTLVGWLFDKLVYQAPRKWFTGLFRGFICAIHIFFNA
jgi:hypothetical protein